MSVNLHTQCTYVVEGSCMYGSSLTINAGCRDCFKAFCHLLVREVICIKLTQSLHSLNQQLYTALKVLHNHTLCITASRQTSNSPLKYSTHHCCKYHIYCCTACRVTYLLHHQTKTTDTKTHKQNAESREEEDTVYHIVALITKPHDCIWQDVEKTARKPCINSAFHQSLDTVPLNHHRYC